MPAILGDLLGSLMPNSSIKPSSSLVPGRATAQDEDATTSGSWDRSRGHKSQGRTHDESDD